MNMVARPGLPPAGTGQAADCPIPLWGQAPRKDSSTLSELSNNVPARFCKNQKASLPDAKHPLKTIPPGPAGHPKRAASPRPYIGKSWGIPLPWLDGDQGGGPNLSMTGISHLQLCQPLAQGPGEAWWADPGCSGQRAWGWLRDSCVPSAHSKWLAGAGSYQIRPGPRGLDEAPSSGREAGSRRLLGPLFLLLMEPTGPTEPCPQDSRSAPTTKKPWRLFSIPGRGASI